MWIYLKSEKKVTFLQISIVPSFKEANNTIQNWYGTFSDSGNLVF